MSEEQKTDWNEVIEKSRDAKAAEMLRAAAIMMPSGWTVNVELESNGDFSAFSSSDLTGMRYGVVKEAEAKVLKEKNGVELLMLMVACAGARAKGKSEESN